MLKSGGDLRRGANNGRWKGGKTERACLECGRVFSVKPSKFKSGRGNFCSKSCGVKNKKGRLHPRWQGEDIEKRCRNCGKLIYIRPSQDRQGRGVFCSLSCHMIDQRKRGVFRQIPNNPESVLINLFCENNLPFRYVRNGEVWLGNRNPDFINTNGKKQVIELLGTYWHPLFDGAFRTEHYKQYGFDCLIIWEDELKDIAQVAKRVKGFVRSQHAARK